jgi:hypothetical protein
MSAAGPPQGANRAPAFGGSAAAEFGRKRGGSSMSAAWPPQGANRAAAFGGSAAAEFGRKRGGSSVSAASVGVHQ